MKLVRPALTALAVLTAGAHPAAAQLLTLGEAADSALATHPLLAAAEAGVKGARARWDAARSTRRPTATATGSLDRFQEPMVVAPLHGFDPTRPPDFDLALVQARLGLEYTLWDGGARGAGIRVAEAGRGAAAAGRDGAALALLEAAADAYLRLASARAVREAADRHVSALAAERDRAARTVAEGSAARVELLRAEAALLDGQAEAATATSGIAAAESVLARLLGVRVEWVRSRELAQAHASPAPRTVPAGPTPGVRAAEQAVVAAQAALDRERAARRPTLRAGAGLVSFGGTSADFVTEWQAGLRVAVPVFTGGARTAAIRWAEAELARAREELRSTRLGEADRVDRAEAAVVEARARGAALEASVTQWAEVARIEALRLDAGVGIQTDYLRAEAGLFHARAGLARARNDEILARVRAAHARGELGRDWFDSALEMGR